MVDTARAVTASDYRAALAVAGEVWEEHLGPLFQEFDAFICPTVASPEIPAENWQKTLLDIDGRRVTDTDLAMTALFNMFGSCPVLAVPSGRTSAGLPTGIQIVGRPYHDTVPFRIATELERRRPWLDCAARRPPHAPSAANTDDTLRQRAAI
jgi:Asp-tRNA(Asn)/Glu-tRNA(Gln) amidotransferase A subunit family amidase